MPKLKRVYGSHTKLFIHQSHPLLACVLDEVGRGGLKHDARQAIQTINALITRGLIIRWTRRDVIGSGREVLKSVGVDIAARILGKSLEK
jgi:hypothetical protein